MKFTINANTVYILVETKFSMSTLCLSPRSVILTVGLSLRLLRLDFSDPSSPTKRTSDD